MKKLIACGLLWSRAHFWRTGPASPFPIEKYQLKNGLRVILSQDNAVPVVTVYMIYNVGARSEEKGRTGFAHLFEHMMFEGSANAPKGMHFATVESNGGSLNGSTHPDFTDYYEVLPSNKLATALWLESDRMRSLVHHDENLKNQKEAVKQERRLSFDNQPYADRHRRRVADPDVPELAELALADRVVRGPELRQRRRRLEVLQDLLRAQQRRAGDRRRHSDSRSQEADRDLLRRHPVAAAAQASRHGRARRLPGRTAGSTRIRWRGCPAWSWAIPGPKRRSPDYYALNMIDAILDRRRQLAHPPGPGEGQDSR